MSDELKPCPFCGDDRLDEYQDDSGLWGVGCLICGATVNQRHENAEAIVAWNRRPAPTPADVAAHLETMTPDERASFLSSLLDAITFCRHCGSDECRGECQNDE
jgi:Lar family restriction alleviation protein